MALHRWKEFWELRDTRYAPAGIRADGPHADGNAETKHFIYFYLGHCAILLFKTQ